MQVNDATDLAVAWGDDGFPTLPVAISWNVASSQTNKRPTPVNGFHGTQRDRNIVQHMFAAAREQIRQGEVLGVGLWPGPAGFLVCDFDTKNNKGGGETLNRLLHQWPDLARCRYRSCSGALNAIVRKPAGLGPVANTVPVDWHGTDIRADAGFVVAPGTITPWGAWEFDAGSVNVCDAWEATADFVAQLRAAEPGRRPATSPELASYIAGHDRYTPATRALVDQVVAELNTAATGSRHGTLISVVGKVVGLDHVDLGDALLQLQQCWDRLTAGEGRERELLEVLAWVVGQEQHRHDDTHDARTSSDDAGSEKSQSAEGRVAPTLVDLFDEVEHVHDWLIPQLIERGDRTVLTGPAGKGKSTLLRQLAVGAALGADTCSDDPFAEQFTPLRVLLVDLENSRLQLRREFEKLRTVVGDNDFMKLAPLVHVEGRTDGLILDHPKDPTGDRAWLEETIAGTRPDILAVGPLYKMHGGVPTEEAPAREVATFLDRLRGRYGFALIIEAHSPHDSATTRPYGASLWVRWPEFGIHLADDGTLSHWRGQREERAWPAKFMRGPTNPVPEQWPWTPSEQGSAERHRDLHEENLLLCQLEVLRAMRKANRPLSREEITDRVDRRRSTVKAAIGRLEDEKAFIITTEDRPRGDGRTYPTKLLQIDPNGPQRGT